MGFTSLAANLRNGHLATYQPDDNRFQFDLAYNGYGSVDVEYLYGHTGAGERPAAADMNADGVDDVGLWVPGESGANVQWYWLVSDGPTLGQISASPPFQTESFGNDLFFNFGHTQALPLVSNFDPPVSVTPATPVSPVNIQGGTEEETHVTIFGTVSLSRQTGAAGLIARYVDADNMYWGGLTNYGGTVYAEIWRLIDGDWQLLNRKRLPALTGEMRFEVTGSVTTGQDQWQQTIGRFQVQNDKLVALDRLNITTLYRLRARNVALQVRVDTLPENTNFGLIGRYQDDNNYYWAGLVNRDGEITAEIWKKLDSTWTLLAMTFVNAAEGTLAFDIEDSLLRLSFDGTELIFANDLSISQGGTAGMYASSGVILDDFEVDAI